MTFPKPVKARVSVPRRSPLKRTKRKILPKCKHCARPHRFHMSGGYVHGGDYCPGYAPARGIRQRRRTPTAALRLMADGLWSKLVKVNGAPCHPRLRRHECWGEIQAMHGIPRTFSATRWLPINGWPGCAQVHKYYTEHKEDWTAWTCEEWGPSTFQELWRIARAMQPVDLEATVSRLRDELQKVSA